VNRPLSLNRWMYTEGNPVNLTDPSGNFVTGNLSKYCNPLSGPDRLECEKIVRGLNPNTPYIAMSFIRLYDILNCSGNGDTDCDCGNNTLHEKLPHNLFMGTWKQYGWWWHYMLDRTPGWWNDNGKGHIYFKDVLTFALAAELSTEVDTDIVGYAAGAMANKGRSDGSFYKMIGSRQSVFSRINTAVYGVPSPELGTSYDFAKFGSIFGEEINRTVAGNAFGIREWGNNILSNTGFTPEQKLAYEFGNVTRYTRNNFPELMAALGRPFGTGIDQVLWYSGDGLAFIVSQAQLAKLCRGGSCVYKDLDN
jgi:hypothetical protein